VSGKKATMTKPLIPNRAPSFRAAFANRNARNQTPAVTSAAKHPVDKTAGVKSALEDIENIRATGRLSRGFSTRSLGPEIARTIGAKIVSEHAGLIETLLVTAPRSYDGDLEPLHARHYQALFAGLGAGVNYIVVCDPRHGAALTAIAGQAGVTAERLTLVSSPRFNYSIWAQDAYVALNDARGGMILCEGVSFPRGEDMTIADDVAAQTDVSVLQSYLYFQGGNVLSCGDVTLVGADYVDRNVARHDIPDETASMKAFAAQFGSRILPLGGEASGAYDWYKSEILSGYGLQPIFHIDMYVTPTGEQNARGQEIVLLGRPSAARDVVGRYSDQAELDNDRYDRFFDETERQLATAYEVRRLPLWITRGTLGYDTEPRYYNLTWNNCVVQNAGSTKRVLLPAYSPDADSYGVDRRARLALEAAAQETWEKLGFEVFWTDGVEDLAFGSGAIHCITKTLRRR
jgi:hypothetical protein